jgi:hypothetical protein
MLGLSWEGSGLDVWAARLGLRVCVALDGKSTSRMGRSFRDGMSVNFEKGNRDPRKGAETAWGCGKGGACED